MHPLCQISLRPLINATSGSTSVAPFSRFAFSGYPKNSAPPSDTDPPLLHIHLPPDSPPTDGASE